MKSLCLTTGLPFMEAAPGAEPVIENGRVRLADTPGLGVRLPEGFLERYPFEQGSGEFSSVTGKMLRP